MNIQSLIVWWVLILWSFVSVTQASNYEENVATLPKTVVDIAIWSDIHTTLVSAVVSADLANTLSSEWPFTVFAPTNEAFSKLPEWTVEMLLLEENIDVLRDILTYHVIPGKVLAWDLRQWLEVNTVQGWSIIFTHSNNSWYVNDSKIIASNLEAENGIIHVVDTVMAPAMSKSQIAEMIYNLRGNLDEILEDRVDNVLSKYQLKVINLSTTERKLTDRKFIRQIDSLITRYEAKSDIVYMLSLLKSEIMLNNLSSNDITDIAITSPEHTTLVTALWEANLVDVLKSDGPFTVFAPTNSAFEKLPTGTVETLLMQESKSDLTNILTYHVVSWAYMASDIRDWLKLTTVNGQALEFSIIDEVVYINGMPTLSTTDIISSNGIVHVINNVLIPSE